MDCYKTDTNNTPANSQVLTASELADFLKIEKRIVSLDAKAGKIPFIMIGRSRRYVLADVVSALRTQNK